MSSGGGGGNTTTTSRTELPSWAQGPAADLLNRGNYLSKRPYQPYWGEQIAGFTGDQLTAQNMIRNQAQQGATAGAAEQFSQGLLSGQGQFSPGWNPTTGATINVASNPYAGQNPYLNQLVQDSQADVTRAYSNTVAPGLMAQFNASGAYGGTAHQSAVSDSQRQLADQLGQVSTSLRGADYQNQQQLAEADIGRRMQAQSEDLSRNAGLYEAFYGRQQDAWNQHQGRQLQALALSPQTQGLRYTDANMLANIGGAQQGLNQSILDQTYANYLEGRDWEPNQLGWLSNALSAATGGSSNTTMTAPNMTRASPWTGALGGAATGAAIGSAVPVIGTGIGALIGAGLGYFGSKG